MFTVYSQYIILLKYLKKKMYFLKPEHETTSLSTGGECIFPKCWDQSHKDITGCQV